MLHLAAPLVKGRGREEYPSFPHPILTRNKRKYWKNAVWGNPAPASAPKGKFIAETLTDNLVRLVRQINTFTG
jgi:creatinine amidohydrolase